MPTGYPCSRALLMSLFVFNRDLNLRDRSEVDQQLRPLGDHHGTTTPLPSSTSISDDKLLTITTEDIMISATIQSGIPKLMRLR